MDEDKKSESRVEYLADAWDKYMILLKKLQPLFAVAIIILLVVSAIGLKNEIKIKKEIKENCGYQQSERVYCVCEKDIVAGIDIPGNPYFIDLNTSDLNFSSFPNGS